MDHSHHRSLGKLLVCLNGTSDSQRSSSESVRSPLLTSKFCLIKVVLRSAQPFEDVYPHLRGCLISHQTELRLSALRILSACPDAPTVVQRCLTGEEVPLDVQGLRERVLRTSRTTEVRLPPSCAGTLLTVTIQESITTDVAAELASRWLLAQLKVNLKPLWKPAGNTITEIIQMGWGERVWSLVWEELQGTQLVRTGDSDDESHSSGEDEDWEDERTWRDPSHLKLRTVLRRWQNEDVQSTHSLTVSSLIFRPNFLVHRIYRANV